MCRQHHFHRNVGRSSIQRCGAALYVYKHACEALWAPTALLLYITFESSVGFAALLPRHGSQGSGAARRVTECL